MGKIVSAQSIQKTAARIANECGRAFEEVLEDLVEAHAIIGTEVEPFMPPERSIPDPAWKDIPFRRTPLRTRQWPLQ